LIVSSSEGKAMKAAAIFVVILLSLDAAGQRGGFKEDTLGESLQEFQSRYPQVDPVKSCERPLPTKNQKHESPQKGQFGGFDTFEDCLAARSKVVPRLLGCFQATGQTNCALLTTILGEQTAAFYEFVNARLYRIQVPFGRSNFENAATAAKEKYGKEYETGTKDYQNRLGAHFDSRYFLWRQDSDLIAVNEIRESGLQVAFSGKVLSELQNMFLWPRDPNEASVLLILDSATAKESAKPKDPADF
jgi:hypothetical protein